MTGAISNKIVDEQKKSQNSPLEESINLLLIWIVRLILRKGAAWGMRVAIHGSSGGWQNMAGQRAASSNKIVDKLKQIAILTEHNKLTTGAIKRPAPFLCG